MLQPLQMHMRLLHHLNPVTDHHQIIPRTHRFLNRLLERHLIQNRPHIQIVRHHQPVIKPQLIPQKPLNDVPRQTARPPLPLRIKIRKPRVPDHHRIQLAQQRRKRHHFLP